MSDRTQPTQETYQELDREVHCIGFALEMDPKTPHPYRKWTTALAEDGFIPNNVKLVNPDGLALAFCPINSKCHNWPDMAGDRFRIYGVFPQGFGPRGHEITVARSRSFKAIAAEVRRRLLPGYAEAYRKARADYDAHHARKAAQQATRKALAALDPSGRLSHDDAEVYFNGAVAQVASYDGTVGLRLQDLTPEQAEAILRGYFQMRLSKNAEDQHHATP